ncbi:hypothetical protein D3C72_615020 [compost metagenome]
MRAGAALTNGAMPATGTWTSANERPIFSPGRQWLGKLIESARSHSARDSGSTAVTAQSS